MLGPGPDSAPVLRPRRRARRAGGPAQPTGLPAARALTSAVDRGLPAMMPQSPLLTSSTRTQVMSSVNRRREREGDGAAAAGAWRAVPAADPRAGCQAGHDRGAGRAVHRAAGRGDRDAQEQRVRAVRVQGGAAAGPPSTPPGRASWRRSSPRPCTPAGRGANGSPPSARGSSAMSSGGCSRVAASSWPPRPSSGPARASRRAARRDRPGAAGLRAVGHSGRPGCHRAAGCLS